MSSASPAKSPILDTPAGQELGPGSDRVFGYFFAAIFAGVGGWAVWAGRSWGWAAVGVGVLLALAAALAPGILHGLNRLWFALGMLLARIVNPLVIGAMFFLVITPMGLLMRAFGARPLSLRLDPAMPTYWVERSPRGPAPESMRDQF